MSFLRRKEIPLAILVFSAFLMLSEFYIDSAQLRFWANELKTWIPILVGFAMIIGGFSLVRRYVTHVRNRTPGQWQYAVFGLGLLAVMGFCGLYFPPFGASYQFNWFYLNWYMPVRSTQYACGAFYVFSTFYRAFRARNVDSVIIIVCAALVLLGAAPIFGLAWTGFTPIMSWLNTVGQLGAMRGMQMAVAMGMILLAFRMIVGMEMSAIGMIPGKEE